MPDPVEEVSRFSVCSAVEDAMQGLIQGNVEDYLSRMHRWAFSLI